MSMSNPVVRIAIFNILLAGCFAGLVSFQVPYLPDSAVVLTCIAILLNGVALLVVLRNRPGGSRPVPPATSPKTDGDVAEGALGKVRPATAGERRPPRPANRHQDAQAPGEMPPWLRMKGNIVMTWNGKHHVAPINGDDPFEVAQRLYERLRRATAVEAGPEAGQAAGESVKTG